jgi:ribosome-associated heat shock protein Hsp15
VEIKGQPVKPAREIQVGEIIHVKADSIIKTLRVVALLDKRVAAKRVPEYLEDLTLPEAYEKARLIREAHALNAASSPPLRPTKRDRRVLEAFLEAASEEE